MDLSNNFLGVFVLFLGYLLLLAGVYVTHKLFHVNLKRPYPVVVESIILSLGIILSFSKIISFSSYATTQSQLLNFLFYPVLMIVSLIGIWKMKRWGLVALFLQLVVAQIMPLIATSWSLFNLIVFLPAVILFYYFKEFH